MKKRAVVVSVYQQKDNNKKTVYEFSYPETKIDFRVSQADTDRPDNCFVKIYGVSRETYSIFKIDKKKPYTENQTVEIYYGRGDDLSLAFSGVVERVIYAFESGSQTITMLITKNTRKFSNDKKSISLNESQTIKSSLEQICKAYGYTVSFGKGGNYDSIGIGRFSHTGTIEQAIKSVLPLTYGYYVKEKSIHVFYRDKTVPSEITVWSQNGLLNYPTEDTEQSKTIIRTILISNVESGMVINVPVDDIWYASTDTGKYRRFVVNNYASSFQNGLGTTEFECEVQS